MKKTVLALAAAMLAVAALPAAAQNKKVEKAKADVAKAEASAANPKSAAKSSTWMKLGNAYLAAFDAPTGDFMLGTSLQEMRLIASQSGQKLENPISEEKVDIAGATYTKQTYKAFDCYLDANGRIALLIVTKPAVDGALDKALDAYIKTSEMDPKVEKNKDLAAAFEKVCQKYSDLATMSYTFGKMAEASVYFEKSAKASVQKPYAKLDTTAVYNAALTAYLDADKPRAKEYYQKCIDLGYFGSDGEAFVKVAEIVKEEGDTLKCQSILEEAFVKFPESQLVLLELINFYSANGGNTDRLFELLDNARSTDKEGKFLYYYNYVEGNIRLQLGDEQGAVDAYDRSAAAKEDYEYAYIGKAQVFSKKADALVEAINAENDWKKYDELMEQYKDAMKKCVEPFEKAYNITKDENLKGELANLLKQICFRLRQDGFQEKYDFYNSVVESAK